MNTADRIMALADEYMRRPLVDSRDGSTTRNALRAEIEALVRDAERYRFLRNHPLKGAEENWPCIRAADNDTAHWALTGDVADSAIDAAMQEKQS